MKCTKLQLINLMQKEAETTSCVSASFLTTALAGFEPATSSLTVSYSTTELQSNHRIKQCNKYTTLMIKSQPDK